MKEIIRKFTFGHPKQMVGPVLWLFVENLFIAFPAIAIYFVIDLIVRGFQNPNSLNVPDLWFIAGIMLVLTLVQLFVSTGAFRGTFLPGTEHSAENKVSFIKKLRTLPLGYFQKKRSGEIINTFTGDFLAMEQSMVGTFVGIFSVIFSSILTAVFFFLFNPTMALALYISVPVTVIVVVISMKISHKLTKRNLEAKDETATYLNEYLLGMKTLKSYNQTGEGFTKLKDAYQHLMKENIRGESIGGSLLNFANALIRLGLPLMCFAGAYLILGGRLSIVDYLGLIVIGTKVISPMITWVRYMVMLRTTYVSADRVDQVMKEPIMKGMATLDATSDIEFNQVSFSYHHSQKEQILKEVSFKIPANKLTAIVGPSGGGKSTILRLLARFWDVDSGSIKCGGYSLGDLDSEGWQKNISMVLQDVYLFHETVRENILFGRKDATEEEMIKASKRAQCHEFIMSLPEGYDTIVGEGGSTLSGGEKQRISIARAILKDSPILLLDEPTASLDARNEILIQKAIGDLAKGRTVVMIAHRLKTVKNAQQIIVLDNGEVKEVGNHQSLMKDEGIYKHLWDLQNQSKEWNL